MGLSFLKSFSKKCSFHLSEFGVKWKFILLTFCLHKSHILENSGSWITGQTLYSHWDCMIIKSAISQEKKLMNQFDFWHDYKDSRNLKEGV